MTAPLPDLVTTLRAKGEITPEDTLAMRRVAWPDGEIDDAEAEAIFDLNGIVKATDRAWVDFFVEAMSVYVVRQQVPQGYVDDVKAAWLIARIAADGRVDSLGELELLVKVLEDAINVPATLKAYTLEQIEAIVLSGTGPTRDGGALDPGSITTAEVKLLRRVLFAQSSDGPAAISRAEADLLFRLKDATLHAINAPEWQTLFVQGVGNYLMAHSDYRPLERAEAARLDTFMRDTHVSVGGFLTRLLKTDVGATFRDQFATKAAPVGHDIAVAADHVVSPKERDWLNDRIDADATLDPLEKALLAFIAEESSSAAI